MENINLANCKLGSVICCDSVSNEEFPCHNLLVDGEKGFMVEYFIRPPVTITVHLPFPVVLSKLSWDTTLGSQICTLHEVYTARTGKAHAEKSCSRTCSVPTDMFWQVGRGMSERGSISFFNRRVTNNTTSQEGLRLGCRENWNALNMVTAVRIKILRTERNTVPCMRNLRIFGLSPGDQRFAKLEQELVKKSETLFQDLNTGFNFFGGGAASSETSKVLCPEVLNTKLDPPCESPSEFLDSITHCLMVLPMTLPSGHHVDRTTLEKCQDSFAAWGGQPRDPFTGKLFTEKIKPVFNAGLKSRIDSFLLNINTSEYSSAGRTLGSAQRIKEFLDNRGTKRKYPGDNVKTSDNTVIIVDSSDEDQDDSSNLDKALLRTLYKVKPILK